ncbi:MAG: DNA polymerase ligase N-terminal domain-containing protein [Thermodesulfobacteriota bacterium]
MNGTHRFLIQKHHTEHPHFDLKLEFGESMKSWILPNRIPCEDSVKTIGIEMKDRAFNSDVFMSAIDDQYGTGESEIWDSGHYDIITMSNEKITLDANGERLKGRFVFIVPSWGRWTGKRLWIMIKIFDH